MNAEASALLVLGIYAAVIAFLVIRSVRQSRDGAGVWLLFFLQRLYSGLMFRWRATNRPCPLPADGAALVVANHRSPVGPMMVWTNSHLRADDRGLRVIGFLTASEYCDVPGLRWLVRTMQSIPVERDGQDMGPTREALRRLKDGRLVGIFPEGGLNLGTDLREPNPGVAFLALKTKAPVYPVYIHGAPQDGDSMVEPFTTRCRVRVTYGERVDLSEWYGRKATQDVLVEVTNLMMSRLAELGGVGFTPVRTNGEREEQSQGGPKPASEMPPAVAS